MAQYAITYAPNYNGGAAPTSTSQTGSFYIGNLSGSRAWNDVVPQTTTNTYFYGSPAAVNVSAYIFALPNAKDAHGAGNPPVDQPQFYYSLNPANGVPALNDASFIGTADFLLRNYAVDGTVNPGSPANPVGCNSVSDCKLKLSQAGWFTSYSFVPPA
jgi:hypothetical protein